MTLNSYAIDTVALLRPLSVEGRHGYQHSSAEQHCYEIAMENLVQLQRIRDLDASILQHAQDSISVMVACE